jgi:hypothetical protein
MINYVELYTGQTLHLVQPSDEIEEISILAMCDEGSWIQYEKAGILGLDFEIHSNKFKHLFKSIKCAHEYIDKRASLRDVVYDILDEIKGK